MPTLTEPLLQVLYFDGKKGVHVLKGGPQEVGFPMALPLFQAHVVGDTAVAGGIESYRNMVFQPAPSDRESDEEDTEM